MEENEIYAVENARQNIEPGGGQDSNDKCGKYFYGGLITGLVIALLVVSGVFLARRVQTYIVAKNQGGTQQATSQNGGGNSVTLYKDSAIDSKTIEKLQVIEKVIDTYFYKEDVDKEAMAEGAYKGLVDSLGDPYSDYYSAEELQQLYQDSQGIYFGIGAYVSLDAATTLAKCSGVIAGTPAEEAGLRENDLFYKVDGVEVYGMSLQEVVSMIKGDEGTVVHLTMLRDGLELELDITRRKVEAPTVNYEMHENGIAYIQIIEFDTVTEDQFAEALATAKGSGMKGLILDLRSNPGGNLSSVVNIARMLLPEGLIVYTEDRDGNRQEYSCDGTRQLQVPMVVLINGNSASASEILAGAIKDYGIGTLLGTTTFGKGIVQRPVELSDGSAVKLTISSYFTPNGTNIHGIGIEPDEVCEFDGERYYSDEKYDNQKERAKELLESMIAE